VNHCCRYYRRWHGIKQFEVRISRRGIVFGV
jgi:hypothetical protein